MKQYLTLLILGNALFLSGCSSIQAPTPLTPSEERLLGTWVETFSDGSSRAEILRDDHTWISERSERDADGFATEYTKETEGTWHYNEAILTLTEQNGSVFDSYRINDTDVAVPEWYDLDNETAIIFRVSQPESSIL